VELLRCADGWWLTNTRTDENGHYVFANDEPKAEGYCLEFNLRYFNLDASFSPFRVAGATADTD
jgi:hypothetical protein